jgi:hypothetical protein
VVDTTGYVTVGTTWSGYGFTVSNNDIANTPACSPATTVTPLCNTAGCTPTFTGEFFGTVGVCTLGQAKYQGFVLAAWYVNQARGSSPVGTWTVPATGGITVTFINPDAAPVVRFQLQDPTGATQWCAPLESGVQIPWGAFLTQCWAGGQQNPLTAGQLIGQAAVVVVQPTLEGGGTPYDICIQNITIQ